MYGRRREDGRSRGEQALVGGLVDVATEVGTYVDGVGSAMLFKHLHDAF